MQEIDNNIETQQEKIIFNNSVVKDKITALKIEKDKLENLSTKIKQSNDELINSNLSGETYNQSLLINENFANEIDKQITELQTLINRLQSAYDTYTEYSETVRESVSK